MRFRRQSSLLLLLLASSALADLTSPRSGRLQKRDGLTKEEIMALNVAANEPVGKSKLEKPTRPEKGTEFALEPTTTQIAKSTASTRPYLGTEDAPVDGQDGKPHAGPFVDTKPEEGTAQKGDGAGTATAKSVPTSLEKFKHGASGAEIPEKIDSVMNDEGRLLPKEGTRGTEGGISEKTQAQKEKGPQDMKKPQEPKEAPPLPHDEQERLEAAQAGRDSDKAKSKPKSSGLAKDGKGDVKDGKLADSTKKDSSDNNVVGAGLGKPTDLPDKPHNIPHPDGRGGNKLSAQDGDEPPVTSSVPASGGRENWLMDTMPYTEGKTNPKKPSAVSSSSPSSSGAAGELEWHEWFHSFVLSLTMILFSEIGDKTFLIAALMAMRHSRLLVFSAAFGALIAMTVLSAVLGHAVPTLLPKRFTTFLAAILFLIFGARSLREGLAMPKNASGLGEEMREVEAELEEKEHELHRQSSRTLESGRRPSSPSPSTSPVRRRSTLAGLGNLLGLMLSPAWVQTFIMTFLGEWGDRSQIATIAMAAGQDYWWVTLGAITGHACCTGIAVIGGRALAGRVSMRVVTIGGALAFLAFGVIYLWECMVE